MHRIPKLLVMTSVALWLTACAVLAPQLIRPPQDTLDSPLIDQRWRLEAANYQGDDLVLDALMPVYFWFNGLGTVVVYSDEKPNDDELCGLYWYEITYGTEQHYRLGDVRQTAAPCPDAQAAQLAHALATFRLTDAYELNGDALILRGEWAEMHFILDNPYCDRYGDTRSYKQASRKLTCFRKDSSPYG